MNDKTKGFILKKNDYRENDELLKILTYDFGLLGFIAKSSKKINSKSRSCLNHLTELMLDFDYREHKELFNIKNISTIKNYYRETNLDEMILTELVHEIYLKLLNVNNQYFKEYYELLVKFYEYLIVDTYLSVCYVIAQCLKIEGISPCVDSCAYCGAKNILGIENNLGFVCKKHLHQAKIFNVIELKKFRYINMVEYKQLDSLKKLNYNIQDLKLLLTFISSYLDTTFKSLKLLENIKNY